MSKISNNKCDEKGDKNEKIYLLSGDILVRDIGIALDLFSVFYVLVPAGVAAATVMIIIYIY